jgi:hypothetical protein
MCFDEQKMSRRPSMEGNKRRYRMGEEGSEVIQLTKEIAGLQEEASTSIV